MPQADVKLVKKVTQDRGEHVSDFVRRAVYKELASLNLLSHEQQKALGIGKEVLG